jgi:hypothetical protein
MKPAAKLQYASVELSFGCGNRWEAEFKPASRSQQIARMG